MVPVCRHARRTKRDELTSSSKTGDGLSYTVLISSGLWNAHNATIKQIILIYKVSLQRRGKDPLLQGQVGSGSSQDLGTMHKQRRAIAVEGARPWKCKSPAFARLRYQSLISIPYLPFSLCWTRA